MLSNNPVPLSITALAPGLVWWQVGLIVLLGAVVGLAIGQLSVTLERWEKLEPEELAERAEYESKRLEHEGVEADGTKMPPWEMETYGWTWLERWLAPIATAVVFGLFALHQGVNLTLWLHLIWVAIMLQIVVFDLKHHLVLDWVTFPALLMALALSPITPWSSFDMSAQGAIVCGVLFLLLYVLGNVLFHGGMGFGDVKLAVLIGAVAGFDFTQLRWGALDAIFYGVVLGGATVLLLMALRIRGLKDVVAYAPFLCVGATLVLYQNL